MENSRQMVYAVGADKKANGPSVGSARPALSNGLFGQPEPVRILAHRRGLSKPIKVTGRFPFKASMSSGVYWIYQISQDRAVYVGSSANVERRIKHHVMLLTHGNHRNLRLQNTWNKYGAADFQLLKLEDVPVERLVEREQFWMDAMPAWPTCNISIAADNPMRGRHHSEESRRKSGDSQRGIPMSAESRIKMSIAHTGEIKGPPSEETRRKMSAAGMGNRNSAGRVLSEESRRKIGDAQRGKKRGPMSEEHKAKISAGNRGKPLTEERKRKISAAHRARRAKLEAEEKE